VTRTSPTTAVITSPKATRRARSVLPDASWVYLGKDVRVRRRTEAVMGPPMALGSQLHDIAADLREPFLNFVGELGRLQPDQVTWWSTSTAWKQPGMSDLFELVCYLSLIERLLDDFTRRGDALVLVVEDPFLRRQAAAMVSSRAHVAVVGIGRTSTVASAEAVGFCKRAAWLLRTFTHLLRQRRWAKGAGKPAAGRQLAAIYSYPDPRCFREEGRWIDPFLPEVDRTLEALGYGVVRVCPPDGRGEEAELGRRIGPTVVPLILHASWASLHRALSARWRPVWPTRPEIAGLRIDQLLRREWLMERSRATVNFYRLFYECLTRFVARVQPSIFVFPFENQPWEKLLVLIARANGTRTVGIQHAVFGSYSLAYFPGEHAHGLPLPDALCASGPYLHDQLLKGGIPRDKLRMTGSVRYSRPPAVPLAEASRSDVLVVLPVDRTVTDHLLDALEGAFGGRDCDLRFHIKAHPMCPVDVDALRIRAVPAPADLRAALERCGLVLFSGTTSGPEAAALGRPVVRYRPELLISIDPSEVLGDDIPTCSDATVREVVLRATQAASGQLEAARLTQGVFAPLAKDAFIRALTGGPQAPQAV
jgi:hypothetical protein